MWGIYGPGGIRCKFAMAAINRRVVREWGDCSQPGQKGLDVLNKEVQGYSLINVILLSNENFDQYEIISNHSINIKRSTVQSPY